MTDATIAAEGRTFGESKAGQPPSESVDDALDVSQGLDQWSARGATFVLGLAWAERSAGDRAIAS